MDMSKICSFFKKKSTLKAIILILYYILIMFVLSSFVFEPLFIKTCEALSGIKKESWSHSSLCNVSAIYNFLIYLILFIPLFIFYRFELKHDIKELASSKEKRNYILISLLVFYMVSVIASTISNLIYNDSSSTNQDTIVQIVKNNALCFMLMTIQACIIGPIVEELIFRQALFDLINNKYLSIAISSILFASMHITSSTGSFRYMTAILIPYLASGILFCIIYEKGHRNIWPCILVHMITNFLSIVAIAVLL